MADSPWAGSPRADAGDVAGEVAVVIPARDAADGVGATVRALHGLPRLRHVIVVDDGSRDATARQAAAAGALVLRHPHHRGRAAALATGADRVAQLDDAAGLPPSLLLFVDADLGGSAVHVAALVEPVRAGTVDMTIAVRPSRRPGDDGPVARLARAGIAAATGFTATEPLSGLRCLAPAAFRAARPLAPGWGLGTALTIDLLLAGFRVVEVPCDLGRQPGAGDVGGRWRQLRDVARVLAVRRARRALPLRVLRVLRVVGGAARLLSRKHPGDR